MDKKTEALKLALDALEHEAEIGNDDAYRRERDAIREALAEQPEQQEPVIDKSAAIRIATALGWEPRREWVGLTYGEVLEQKKDDPIQFYRAIEAKLREKNA